MSQFKAPPPGSLGGAPSPDQQQQLQQMMGQSTTVPSVSPSTAAPRELGTPVEEAKRAVQDVAEGITQLPQEFLNGILASIGIQRAPQTPEEQAKLQQFHHNLQRLDAEQLQAFQMRMQQEEQRKEMLRQQDEMKAQQEQQAQGVSVPGGKRTGQGALDKLQQDRKGMGGASG